MSSYLIFTNNPGKQILANNKDEETEALKDQSLKVTQLVNAGPGIFI